MGTANSQELELYDIQGKILRGYGRLREAAHLFGEIDEDAVRAWRDFLARVADLVTSVSREDPDELRRREVELEEKEDPNGNVLSIGLSFRALELLDREFANELDPFKAFKSGMAARAALLGDPAEIDWRPWSRRHVWLSVSGLDRKRVDEGVQALREMAEGLTLEEMHPRGRALVKGGRWYEHFGFRDDVSKVIVAGVPYKRPGAVNGGGVPDPSAPGGWRPIAAGEFLLGYHDEAGEDPTSGFSERTRALLKNGTFGVFRKLVQDVAGFHHYVTQKAHHKDVEPEWLAEKLVGRKKNGDSLTSPGQESNFTYESDPHGSRCAIGAHIRRANPRTSGQHRLIRRGIPFGPEFVDGAKDPSERGMYFVVFNASIENQFEFVQSTWLNKSVGAINRSRDPLAAGGEGVGRMLVEGDATIEQDAIPLLDIPRFVTCRGGEYYFMPGRRALRAFAGVGSTEVVAVQSSGVTSA